MMAVKEYGVKQLLLAGGVSANSGIREKFKELCEKENVELVVPNMKYCTDNATMIAACGYFLYKKGVRADLDLNAKSSEKLF